MKRPEPVCYWRTAHRRNSVRALILGSLVQAGGAAWSALPGSYIYLMPRWVPFAVSGVIFALGLLGAYLKQPELEE